MLESYEPQAPLNTFVKSIWVFESRASQGAKERALPDGCMQLIINLREDQHRVYDRHNFEACHTYNGALVIGPQMEFCVIDSTSNVSFAGVAFRPGGAYPFFASPASEMQDLHVPLDCLWGSLASDLRDRLLEARTVRERLILLECALLQRVQRPLTRHPAVSYALQRFRIAPGTESITDVQEKSGLSSRRFIELFRREVGLAPKRFCRIRRFHRALHLIASGQRIDWADIALTAGYFDQSHFIHDFQAFSGINPSTYLEARPSHVNHVPLPK